MFPAGLSKSGRDKKEACSKDLRLLVELEAAIELTEVEFQWLGEIYHIFLPTGFSKCPWLRKHSKSSSEITFKMSAVVYTFLLFGFFKCPLFGRHLSYSN